MNEPIITSILDTDLYKITMAQVVFHQYPTVRVKYQLKCRNKGVKLGFLAAKLQEEINTWKDIKITKSEFDYIGSIRFIQYDFINWLRKFRFNPSLVKISVSPEDDLILTIEGKWLDTILFEVPLLAAINELYFRETTKFSNLESNGKKILENKLELLNGRPNLQIMEFGTRRRYSKEWQDYAFSKMVEYPNFTGTSNINLAMKYNKTAKGTMAHEYISAHLALVDRIEEAQKRAFHVWLQEYDEDLGIALSDTFTSKAFFLDFNSVLSKVFSGIRHDSGNPVEFGNEVLSHYSYMNIDARTKNLVFSDSLNIPKAIDLFEKFIGKIGLTFGIGTNLTNDLGADALNVVIKLTECNGIPVVKLSDDVSKAIGDKDMIEKVVRVYGLK